MTDVSGDYAVCLPWWERDRPRLNKAIRLLVWVFSPVIIAVRVVAWLLGGEW